MCIKDSINKTCRKNEKDLSNGAPNIKLWNHTKKPHFPFFAKNFRRPCMKLKNFFCQFPNPWILRVSGMGGYTSKCEKSQNHCTLVPILDIIYKTGYTGCQSRGRGRPLSVQKSLKLVLSFSALQKLFMATGCWLTPPPLLGAMKAGRNYLNK
jgi:hypothetical protein